MEAFLSKLLVLLDLWVKEKKWAVFKFLFSKLVDMFFCFMDALKSQAKVSALTISHNLVCVCVCVSFLCLVTTTRPRQYSVTIQWVPQSPIPSDLLSYVLEYRQDLGGGRFGEWTTGGSNIDRTASSYVVTLPGGTYEYRVLGVLSSGVRREIEGGEVQDGQGGSLIIFTF